MVVGTMLRSYLCAVIRKRHLRLWRNRCVSTGDWIEVSEPLPMRFLELPRNKEA